jgi:D-alanyl-lipoteichoic acid acyltransferase DltB (MBOAT superfamily)
MAITSFNYLLAVIFIAIIYYTIAKRVQWLLLLITSLGFFYCWSATMFPILIGQIFICYFGAQLISKSKNHKNKITTALIVLCIAPLAYFKYYLGFAKTSNNFTSENIIFSSLGLSFFSFQSISYLVDVRRGYLKPELHFGYLALHLSFFTNILAGPLERAKKFIPQFKQVHFYNTQQTKEALLLILWGWFKKIVIAQKLNVLSILISHQSPQPSWVNIFVCGVIFTLQIFYDYSAYCDIGMGSAKLFGINLSKSFTNSVFTGVSRTSAISVWNITVSAWFRDYVFIPLSKYTTQKWQVHLNRMFTFILSGLWHGASIGFIVWGFLNWLFSTIEALLMKNPLQPLVQFKSKINFSIRLSITLSAIITFMIAVFNNFWFHTTFISFANVFNASKNINWLIKNHNFFITPIVLIVCYETIAFMMKGKTIDVFLYSIKNWQRTLLIIGMIEYILYSSKNNMDFYYFRF